MGSFKNLYTIVVFEIHVLNFWRLHSIGDFGPKTSFATFHPYTTKIEILKTYIQPMLILYLHVGVWPNFADYMDLAISEKKLFGTSTSIHSLVKQNQNNDKNE